MDIALNKIAKDEMSKRLRGAQITIQGCSMNHIIMSSKPSHQHLLSIQGPKKSIEQTA
jgi:hypothetical protein